MIRDNSFALLTAAALGAASSFDTFSVVHTRHCKPKPTAAKRAATERTKKQKSAQRAARKRSR